MFSRMLHLLCFKHCSLVPDGPDVQPDKVGGGEGVDGRYDPHQVRLLVPDPVE